MSSYTDEYYFITYISDKNRAQLGPDEDTLNLRFETEDVTSGGRRPLIFHNVAATIYPKAIFSSPPPDIIFSGADIAVDDKIYEKIIEKDIPNLILQPAIYIDEKEIWHENYWFLTFTKDFDCWDRNSSEYDSDPIEMNGENFFSAYRYNLDKNILDKTNLKDRLLFKMGGDMDGFIVVHKSIASIFDTGNIGYTALVPIKEYGTTFTH